MTPSWCHRGSLGGGKPTRVLVTKSVRSKVFYVRSNRETQEENRIFLLSKILKITEAKITIVVARGWGK